MNKSYDSGELIDGFDIFPMSDLHNRRIAIKLMVGAATGVFGGISAKSAPTIEKPSLNSLAAHTGRTFGSTVYSNFQGSSGSFEDPQYRTLLVNECKVIVPGNELKWNRIQRLSSSMRPDFTAADRIIKYAVANNFKIRGHCLLWHHPKRTPTWMFSHDFGTRPAQSAIKMLDEHITTICRRYNNKIYSYDVVNEAVDPRTGTVRTTPLSQAAGGSEVLLDAAFQTASLAAPGIELVYNDYMSWQPESSKHRSGVLRLLEGFRKRGVPVNALGCQSHLYAGSKGMSLGSAVADQRAWRSFLDEVVGMGYRVLVTELDVNDIWLPNDTQLRDTLAAEMVGAYLDIMLSYNQLSTIICWDLVNRYSYLQLENHRPDRRQSRSTPYDNAYRPTAIRGAIAQSLKTAVTTN